ncbi:cellulase family glycosylhydrolase [Larkinella insperata]|uniref:Cellulase family glycosylhydrolase n=1 Tax=Larkinella insperata TaxID=332158 RepID=A0ABW3Q396_9BACT|nr:cellulase family glycosylhydrolase [Larkinella insperata]
MKKRFSTLLSGLVALLFCIDLFAQSLTPLAANGRLRVVNRQLTNEAGSPIQLRGMSSHGLHWFGSCYTPSALQTLATGWGADVFRAAMYISEGGYLNDKVGLQNKVNQLVDWSEQNGMYCIIDWHILNPGDPNIYTNEAMEFFRLMAQRHAGKKHVIYEICNEPNGVSWAQIKSYAEKVIPVIRQYDQNAIILVGTPSWSGSPWEVVGNPLTGANATNVMYTFHFYAGSHYLPNYRANMENALANIPIFASEWGTSNYSGNGGNDYNSAQAWIDFFAGNNASGIKVSWCNWSFADKAETSAALNPGACAGSNWNNTSESGTWVKSRLLNPADQFGPPTPSVAITSPTNNATVTVGSSPVVTATVTNATATKVEFYNGTTKLGEDATAPYSWTISSITAGVYSLTAKAILATGGPLTSPVVRMTAVTSPPPTDPGPNPGGALNGPACVAVNEVKTFEVNANLLANATNFSWWCTGSTRSITPVQSGKATISFGPSFTGGQVCVGVNYSVAPWYRQICTTVTVCNGTPPPAANQAPTISLTTPANSATFAAPATVTLQANATDADGTIAKVEFYNGTTKLGEDLTPPYQFTWNDLAAGTYTLSARATDNRNATAQSGSVTMTVKAVTPPPTSPGTDLIGPDCVAVSEVKTYELTTDQRANATSFSWWVTGSTQSLTPVSAGKVSINFGQWFTGGQVCVGVNYSVAPWYKQICKPVTVCPNARLTSVEPETTVSPGVVYPNPSQESFVFTADDHIRQLSVTDASGREPQPLGELGKGQQVRFGSQLPAGSYWLQIRYENNTRRAVKLIKAGR